MCPAEHAASAGLPGHPQGSGDAGRGTLPIVCIATGELYGRAELYITRLDAMLRRHSPRPHTLYCYTDRPRTLPACIVQRDCRGWTEFQRPGLHPTMAKLGLFNPAYVEFDAFLYLDLSLIVRRDLGPVLDFACASNAALVIVSDWYYDGYNSSVMWIRPRELRAVYDAFVQGASYEQHIPGDQDFIRGAILERGLVDRVAFFPAEQIVSFRRTVKLGRRDPAGAARQFGAATIVKFHGKPKMHEAFGLRYRARTRLREWLHGRLRSAVPFTQLERDWAGE